MATARISNECCACNACENICPKDCISSSLDAEGFKYAVKDLDVCINCGLCEKVCQYIQPSPKPRMPKAVFAGYNTDEAVRLKSSSGGVFSLLAKETLRHGGAVFGAKFNEKLEVVHDFVENKDDLPKLYESKYIQSEIGLSFRKVKEFLKTGRKVLFCGTPCQIRGLRMYLNEKEYENLTLVDFVCHGVPSPGVWQKYLDEKLAELGLERKDIRVSFRSKSCGWKNRSFSIHKISENKNVVLDGMHENPFLHGFLANLYLRKSCTECPAKHFSSGSDFTICDAWGIEKYHPEIDDDKGCSIICILTEKGEKTFSSISDKIKSITCDISILHKHNPAAYESAKLHKRHKKFFKLQKKGLSVSESVKICLPPPTYFDKVMWSINKRIKKYVKKES